MVSYLLRINTKSVQSIQKYVAKHVFIHILGNQYVTSTPTVFIEMFHKF